MMRNTEGKVGSQLGIRLEGGSDACGEKIVGLLEMWINLTTVGEDVS